MEKTFLPQITRMFANLRRKSASISEIRGKGLGFIAAIPNLKKSATKG